MEWTSDQQQVICLHQRNLLVSAAAGSGKTAVLVERIIQMILNEEEPADIDRLLVVTFTKAAAAQMRERIGAALEEALECDPENAHLQSQSALLPNAQISTFHSFCLRVIRDHFFEIGIDPGFRIGDEREVEMLKNDVMDDVMEEFYQLAQEVTAAEEILPGMAEEGAGPAGVKAEFAGTSQASPVGAEEGTGPAPPEAKFSAAERRTAEDFRFLIRAYGNAKNDANICGMAVSLYRYADSYPWPNVWLDGCLAMYECGSAEEMCAQPWMQELLSLLRDTVEDMIRAEERLLAVTKEEDGPAAYGETIRSDLMLLLRLQDLETYEEWYEAFADLKFAALPRKRQSCDAAKKELVKSGRDAVKNQLKDLRKAYFSASPEDQFAMLEHERPAMRALIALTKRFMERFAEAKEDRAMIDFSDIEHFTLRILVDEKTGQPTAAAREYQEQFIEVMVDEYQDSNYVQEELLRAVSRRQSGRNNLFMVGDVKQSIYRFRLARPENFVEKYDSYTKEESENQRIDLHMNFRSRPQVLDFTNEIFYHCMDRDIGNIAYDDAAALYAGADFADSADAGEKEAAGTGAVLPESPGRPLPDSAGPEDPYAPEILLIRPDAGDDMQQKVEMEARAAAYKIREMVSAGGSTLSAGGSVLPPGGDGAGSASAAFGAETVLPGPVWEFRDIVILVPVTKGWSEVFLRIFSEEGVPLVTESKTGYFAAVEVETIIELLKILNNPRQDIALAGVMRSPVGGFSDEELAQIRLAQPDVPFYEAVLEIGRTENSHMPETDVSFISDSDPKNGNENTPRQGENPQITAEKQEKEKEPAEGSDIESEKRSERTYTLDSALKEKISAFLALLDHFREQIPDTPVHEVIQNIYRETGYLDYVTALPGGERRRANLEMFLELAIAYEGTSYQGLFDFIRYIGQMQKTEQDYGEAETVSEQENAVRLMTIHKSKGLEFPVVFLCGMGKQFNMQALREPLIFHPRYGAGLQFKDAGRGIRRKFLAREVFALLEKREMLGEEMRLLYVALTRAKEKLILTGILDEKKNYRGSPLGDKEKLTYAERSGANCFFDWVMPVIKRGKAEAIVNEITSDDLAGAHQSTQVSLAVRRAQILSEMEKREPDAARMKELDEMLLWHYPYKNERRRKQKVSVSELKHHPGGLLEPEEAAELYREPEIIPYIPRFADRAQEENAGTLHGTAMHRFLACVDFGEMKRRLDAGSFDAAGFAAEQADAMQKKGRISQEVRDRLNVRQLVWFLESTLAARMADAEARGELFRERPFMMALPAERVWADAREEETGTGVLNRAAVQEGDSGAAKCAAVPEGDPGAANRAAVPGGDSGAANRAVRSGEDPEPVKSGEGVPAHAGEETILVQGIVDAFWIEDGRIILLDFKTDAVRAASELIDRYRVQLALYAEALARVFDDCEVGEVLICSFRLREVIPLEII